MDVQTIMNILQEHSDVETKRILLRHGVSEPFFGVRVGEMEKIIKEHKLRNKTELGLLLYDTDNADAMYLAGLIVKATEMTCDHLQHWVERSRYNMTSEYTIPQVAADSGHGLELALRWIRSDKDSIASAGWSTLSNVVLITPNDTINIPELAELLEYVEEHLQSSADRVRYAMNGFVIAVGSSVPELTDKALSVAKDIGKVKVDIGDTSCKVPDAASYIKKALDKRPQGVKKKQARR